MKLPDIPAIAIGVLGLYCLTHMGELPGFVTDLADNAFVASCLEGLAKYADVARICAYVASGVFLVSGILRIWEEAVSMRVLWGIGSAALAMELMILLNDAVFAWAWTCDLYSAGTTEVVLTVFHFCWLFLCPFSALFVACATSDECIVALPGPFCAAAMPFWVIPVAAVVGFLASLVPWAALLLVLIPLNYLFLVVDGIFIVLAFIFVAILLKLGLT